MTKSRIYTTALEDKTYCARRHNRFIKDAIIELNDYGVTYVYEKSQMNEILSEIQFPVKIVTTPTFIRIIKNQECKKDNL